MNFKIKQKTDLNIKILPYSPYPANENYYSDKVSK